MKWELKMSGQFKKDLKRYKRFPDKLKELEDVLHYLRNSGNVPLEYFPHPLSWDYKGCMECHIEGDYLLIWRDETSRQIKLLRLGSHSELFRKF